MASISNDAGGRRRLQFFDADRVRRTIRLGKVDRKTANGVRERVEKIVGAAICKSSIDDDTSRWIATLPDTLHAKLAAAGLFADRGTCRLGPWVDSYIAGRTDAKPGTITHMGHTRRNLVEFFGADRQLRSITPGDADDWRRYIIGEKLGDNTVRRRCGIAKQLFRAAIRKRLIESNPFADLKAAVQANPSKLFFITREMSQRVLDACPNAQWRLLFALSRYGGLRCPSEHLGLTWADVNWEKGRMLVHSPKTEHHAGGDSRWVPIFPELRPYLLEVFEAAEPGSIRVITEKHDAAQNLRTRMLKIIRRAGLDPWPKLFQNLRATRETELAETWPEHVVTKWIGHTTAVARKHYLQITEDHFARASAEPFRKASQNQAQHTSEKVGTEKHGVSGNVDTTRRLPGDSELCLAMQTDGMGDEGFEPPTPSV